ncbi:hypothetical protein SLA2020_259520 [Shorea laevis]
MSILAIGGFGGFVSGFRECLSIPLNQLTRYRLTGRDGDAHLPKISPSATPQPFLPILAPSPLAPFTNTTVTKLSGICMLNFTAIENLMRMTSIDCFVAFAPLLANAICCP